VTISELCHSRNEKDVKSESRPIVRYSALDFNRKGFIRVVVDYSFSARRGPDEV